MMFIHDIDNNILNYGAKFLSVYQDEFERLDIYQDNINSFGMESNQKTSETAVHVINPIINI